MNNIVVKKGEDKILSLIITDSDGVAVPLTNQTVRFRCRRTSSDSYLFDLVNTSVDHDDVLGGLTSYLLDKSISSITSSQLYYWELEIEDEITGFVSIQDVRGNLTIKSTV